MNNSHKLNEPRSIIDQESEERTDVDASRSENTKDQQKLKQKTKKTKKTKKNKKRFKWTKRIIYSLLILLFVLCALVMVILTTNQGLKWAVYGVNRTLNSFVTIEKGSGSLSREFTLTNIAVTIGEDRFTIGKTKLKWNLWSLLKKTVDIDTLLVSDVVVNIKSKNAPKEKTEPFELPLPIQLKSFQLPISAKINAVNVNHVLLQLPNELTVTIPELTINNIAANQEIWTVPEVLLEGEVIQGDLLTLPLKINLAAMINPQSETVAFSLNSDSKGTGVKKRLNKNVLITAPVWALPPLLLEYSAFPSALLAVSLNQKRSGLVTDNVDPSKVDQRYEYLIDHRLNLDIKGALNDLTVTANIKVDEKEMLPNPTHLIINARVEDQAKIDLAAKLQSAQNRIELKGAWSRLAPDDLNAVLMLNAEDLSASHPKVTGSIKGDFEAKGTLLKPLLKGDVNAKGIAAFGASLKTLTLSARHNEEQTTKLELLAKNIGFNDLLLKSVKLDIDGEKITDFRGLLTIKNLINKDQKLVNTVNADFKGSLLAHTLTVNADSPFATLGINGKGRFNHLEEGGKLTFYLENVVLKEQSLGTYKLAKPTYLFASRALISMSSFCLNNLPTTLCIEGKRDPKKIIASAVLRSFPPSVLDKYLPEEVKINTALDMVVSGKFVSPEDFIGIANVSLKKGKVNYKLQGRTVDIPLSETQLKVLAMPKNVEANLALDWGDYLQMSGKGAINEPFKTQAINAELNARVPSLKWLMPLVPDIQRLEGLITAKANISGTIKKPQIGANITLNQGNLYIAEYNSEIKDIAVDIALNPGQSKLEIKGGLTAGAGKMEIVGSADIATLNANVNLKGANLLLANSELVKVLANPDIQFESKNKTYQLKGQLLIPELTYVHKASDDTRGSVKGSSPDTVIISRNEKQKSDSAFSKLAMDFKVILGDKISVGAMGFLGTLTGDIQLLKKVDKPIFARGIINVGSGAYEVLGQELNLDKGRIQFLGGAITNPSVEFQASRQFDNKRTGAKVNVGVRVNGTVKRLKLKLFSRPNMPDSSILSYIALGKDPETLGAVETLTMLNMARKLMSGDIVETKGEKNKDFASQFGLSEAGFTQDLSGNTAFGIGKSITENLYFGLGMGIFEQGAFATVRYKFLKWFNLDSQIGTEHTSFDVRYSKEM